ncbi:hypothetical protein [Cryobacterium melibiosiphilum]|uniref:hypothetical protein n=1 Tax=Cryobacterium melibiosiphilum TaxID=995039 RepID=UPI0011C22137|nr:hypothetical protein [Cryobacterium melibiosiphilum]
MTTTNALLPDAALPPALAVHTIWCDADAPESPARLVFAVHVVGRRAQLAGIALTAVMIGLAFVFPSFFIAGITVGCAAALGALALTDRFGTGFYPVEDTGTLGPRIVSPAPDRRGLSRRRVRWF